MTHVLTAAVLQLSFGGLFGFWLFSAVAISAFYIGREHAQAEYRVISKYYSNKRANMPWYGGFEPRAWTLKGVLDWLLPTLATFAVAICLT